MLKFFIGLDPMQVWHKQNTQMIAIVKSELLWSKRYEVSEAILQHGSQD